MPSPMGHSVITEYGARLLSRAQAGEIQMKFKAVAVGNGNYTEAEKTSSALYEASALKSQKNRYTPSGVELATEKSVLITALITNCTAEGESLVDTGYYINEIGLFAVAIDPETGEESGNEILYSIAVVESQEGSEEEYARGDYMPPFAGNNPAQIIQEIYVTVSNSAETYIDFTGAYATAQDLENVKETVIKIQDGTIKTETEKDLEERVAKLEEGAGCKCPKLTFTTTTDIDNIIAGTYSRETDSSTDAPTNVIDTELEEEDIDEMVEDAF